MTRSATAPAPWVETFDVDGPVHAQRWPGPGQRTIVCLHGLGETHLGWMVVAPGLAEHGTVVTVDQPGFGLTPRNGRRMDIPGAARWLHRLLPMIGTAPPILVGSSFGGAVAAACAAEHPAQVAGLVLTSSFLPPAYHGWKAPAVVASLLGDRLRSVWRNVADPSEAKHKVTPGWLLEAARRAANGEVDEQALCQDLRRHDDHASGRGQYRSLLEATASLVWHSMRPGMTQRLYDRIRCPVLLVHGRDDIQVPADWAAHQHDRHPEWRLHLSDGEGHVTRLDDPREWLECVGAFASEISSSP